MDNMSINGSATLQAKLNEPQTVAALTRLLDRIESLEQTVNTLADLVTQGPGMAAMVGDVVDETVRSAADRGVDVDQRLRTALQIAEELTAPEMVDKLDRLLTMADEAPGMAAMVGDIVDESVRSAAANGIIIEDRLRAGLAIAEKLTAPEMAAKLDTLLDMADQAPLMAAMVGDIVDESVQQVAAKGINLEERLRAGLALTERLTEPTTLASLNQLLDMAEQGPGLVAMVGDVVDETAVSLDLESRLHAGLSIAEKATQPETLNKLDEMFDILLEAESGVLNPEAVRTVGKMAQALVASQKEAPPKVGLFGLMRTLGDPEIQTALGFLINFAKHFGRRLNA